MTIRRICVALFTWSALAPVLSAPAVHAQRRITDADVERVLPMLASPLGRSAGAASAATRGALGVEEYMALTTEAATEAFDPLDWIRGRSPRAEVPPNARYARDCSKELPVAAVKFPGSTGRLASDAFTPTALFVLADGAEAAARFYRERGFSAVGAAGATVRLLAPDSTLLVTISRSNPHAGEPFLRPACNGAGGATVELARFRPSWHQSEGGWSRARYEAELERRGLEHREYWAIVSGLAACRTMVDSAEWAELSEYERELIAPNLPVYLRHRARLDPLLDLLENEALDI
jgi:hypothetical protein